MFGRACRIDDKVIDLNLALLHQKSYPPVRSTGSQEILVAFPPSELARVIVRGSLLLATAPQRFASRWVRFWRSNASREDRMLQPRRALEQLYQNFCANTREARCLLPVKPADVFISQVSVSTQSNQVQYSIFLDSTKSGQAHYIDDYKGIRSVLEYKFRQLEQQAEEKSEE